MNKKYTVFISSTYEDLKKERNSVLNGIMQLQDFIPVGMEYFPAEDSNQMDVIKSLIDQCDLYIVIIGDSYGSIDSNTGKSYTELEFDYALEKGIKILGFIKKSNHDDKNLKKFISKIEYSRMCKQWNDEKDLQVNVIASLSVFARKYVNELVGWIRSDDDNLKKINQNEIDNLNSKILKLQDELQKEKSLNSNKEEFEQLEFENYEIEIKFKKYSDSNVEHFTSNLKDVFKFISRGMIAVSYSKDYFISKLESFFKEKNKEFNAFYWLNKEELSEEIINQFIGLKLMYANWLDKNKQVYIGLTESGRNLKDKLLLKRKCTK